MVNITKTQEHSLHKSFSFKQNVMENVSFFVLFFYFLKKKKVKLKQTSFLLLFYFTKTVIVFNSFF